MTLAPYRLPDGRIVLCDASATKDARIIDFTLANGSIVSAIQAGRNVEYSKRVTAYCARCRSAQYHDQVDDGSYACMRCYHRGGVGDAR